MSDLSGHFLLAEIVADLHVTAIVGCLRRWAAVCTVSSTTLSLQRTWCCLLTWQPTSTSE